MRSGSNDESNFLEIVSYPVNHTVFFENVFTTYKLIHDSFRKIGLWNKYCTGESYSQLYRFETLNNNENNDNRFIQCRIY